MIRFAIAVCLVAVASGCSAAGIGFAPATSAALASVASAPSADGGADRASADASAIANAGSGANHLYVGNAGTNAITIYRKMATGNVAPERTIGGPHTGITCLKQTAVDGAGNVYVANFSALDTYGYCATSGGGDVLVFAPGANGDVAPIRTIGGGATGISNAAAVAVASDGTLYVGSSQFVRGGATSVILKFAPGATGNVAPVAASATLPDSSIDGLTLDPTLGVIASFAPGDTSFVSAKIGYFSTDLGSGGAAIAWDDPGPLASDPATHTYVGVGNTVYGQRIDRYADGTTGAYAGPGGIVLSPGLTSSLLVPTCPSAVAIGPGRELYVAGTCPNSVAAYLPGATGTAGALRVIAGPLTQLSAPAYLTVGV